MHVCAIASWPAATEGQGGLRRTSASAALFQSVTTVAPAVAVMKQRPAAMIDGLNAIVTASRDKLLIRVRAVRFDPLQDVRPD
jgi:hypothetical protein